MRGSMLSVANVSPSVSTDTASWLCRLSLMAGNRHGNHAIRTSASSCWQNSRAASSTKDRVCRVEFSKGLLVFAFDHHLRFGWGTARRHASIRSSTHRHSAPFSSKHDRNPRYRPAANAAWPMGRVWHAHARSVPANRDRSTNRHSRDA